MTVLTGLPDILAEAEKEYVKPSSGDYSLRERYGGKEAGNILAVGEASDFIRYLLDERNMAKTVDMIYIDPPFFTKAKHAASLVTGEKVHAFSDVWKGGEESYLKSLALSLYGMKELLSDKGLIWVHIDWHMSHYIRILMDEIFGGNNFVNEIVWQYKSGGSTKRRFARKHDTILVYSKTGGYFFNPLKEKSYNRGLKPYGFKGIEEYEDDKGWYTMVNMKDVWFIDMVGRTSGERTGYATQKPEKLLERIIASSTEEGGLCADFYGGSATMAAVAARMNRRFITGDAGDLAAKTGIVRLTSAGASFDVLAPEEKLEEPSGIEIHEGIIDVSEYIRDKDIDFWSVDPDYDGHVHHGSTVICRGRDRIETCADLGSGQMSMFSKNISAGNRISIVFYDMKGSRLQTVINIKR